MGDPVIRVVGASVRLGGREVLSDVDFELRGGELVGLIGPNGAGKTTLLRTVLGLLPLESGSVEVHGRSARRAQGSVGYVPQRHEFAWDFPITVAGAVATGRTHLRGLLRRRSADDLAAVEQALERVGMSDLAGRPVGELSGGQRQRVLVARALALRPGTLLLDEPFTGIDVPTQELLSGLLAQLRDEGVAVLMTTHDLAAATALCSRLCLLNRTVVADGEPKALADTDIWLRTFGLDRAEQLLRSLGVGR
ncbi:anchored repeat-type ABC transporter ATP-binding subunit [Actinosynnema pretiosum subsp. pretiosum]|uniref:Anchored repeat-type ABC transporter ATP-binding subunit n=1 Tax=Actinosynnema pretiosum subsp. pretiosum TaxID=103721 RepID=A0AA45R3K2_9PSEU|nr:Zinc ABC transporter, ATP-binding protein ZnuC [Actinosynnema pretiosum subsp. pretiosum]QUF03844.1 anchored repeat-type ABC transporter ATP-binding subunit [Actinosynnema pretiosum subsp. pretiosum]